MSMCTRRPSGPCSSPLPSVIATTVEPLQRGVLGSSSLSSPLGLLASVGGVPASSMAGVAASASVELGVSASMPLVALAEGMKGSIIGEGEVGVVVASMAGLEGLSSTFDVGLVSSSMFKQDFPEDTCTQISFFLFLVWTPGQLPQPHYLKQALDELR